MFSNQTRTPQIRDDQNNIMWGSADNFTFTGYNSNYITCNEATGSFTSTSGSGCMITEVTAIHKVTGFETMFNVVINPEVALVGVDNGDNHDHASCYINVESRLRNNGYSNVYRYTGTFETSDIDEYLSNDNYNIFVSRSHASVEMFFEDMQQNSYILLNELSSSNEIRYRSNASIKRFDLSNLRLAMFIGCRTGSGGVGGNNLPSAAVAQGAETAIGFTDTINCPDANAWTQEFFVLWDSGSTVEMVCSNLARSSSYRAGNLHKYIICGDQYTYID